MMLEVFGYVVAALVIIWLLNRLLGLLIWGYFRFGVWRDERRRAKQAEADAYWANLREEKDSA